MEEIYSNDCIDLAAILCVTGLIVFVVLYILKAVTKQSRLIATLKAEKLLLQVELECEKEEKEIALKRLSAMMSSRVKDGNPNIVDLSDQNRPNKLGEQFSELYDNQWTNAYDDIDNFFGKTKPESEIIRILLDILELCFAECKNRSTYQLEQLRKKASEIASIVTRERSSLQTDLMQRIKKERKTYAGNDIPELDEILPKLKSGLTELDMRFLDKPLLQEFVKECLRLSWLMVIQDPPMVMVFKPESDSFEKFRAYKTRGSCLGYVVWPALLLEDGGRLVLKGVAEFTDFLCIQ